MSGRKASYAGTVGGLVTLGCLLAAASAHAAATSSDEAAIKAKFGCTDRNVLCVNSCDGSIIAKTDGATASFRVSQNTTIIVKVAGFCRDDGATYTPNVAYHGDASSVLKVPPPPPKADQLAVRQAVDPISLGSMSIVIAGQSTDRVAVVTVARTPAALHQLPVDISSGHGPVDWGIALASYTIDHGRYYLDFGVGLALVPQGKQTIAAVPYRGDSNDLRLSTETSTPTTPIFAAFVYPFGHLRDGQAPWQDRGSFWRDLIVLEVATELSRENLLRSIYLGAGIEPVSGLNIVAGGAFVPVTVYRAGAQDGLLVQNASAVDTLTRQTNVVRFFVAISASTEIFNSAKTAFDGVASP